MRKDEVWQNRSWGRIEPIFPNGADILHKGSDRYFNFKDVVGDLGYCFRDNAGVMEVKDNTGAWTPFSSLWVSDHSLLTNLDYASSGHTGFQPAGTYIDWPVPWNDTDIIFNDW